jgi:hypothetical protein
VKIEFAWKREVEGVTEIDVPEDEVRAWLDDPVTGGERAGNVGEITAEDCLEWLKCGDDDYWSDQINPDRDETGHRNEYELDGLA